MPVCIVRKVGSLLEVDFEINVVLDVEFLKPSAWMDFGITDTTIIKSFQFPSSYLKNLGCSFRESYQWNRFFLGLFDGWICFHQYGTKSRNGYLYIILCLVIAYYSYALLAFHNGSEKNVLDAVRYASLFLFDLRNQ